MIDTVVNVINSLLAASLILAVTATVVNDCTVAAIFWVLTLAASFVGSIINICR